MQESEKIKKRVMFVGSSLGGGGAERVMSILINNLPCDTYVIKMIRLFNSKITFKLNDNVDTEYIGNEIRNPYIKKCKLIWKLRSKIKEFQPDVIVSFLVSSNEISTLAAAGCNVKVIISERNDPHNNVRSKFAAWVRNIVYLRADLLVCQTNEAVKYFPMSIQKKSVVIPNPIQDNLPNCFSGERKKNVVMVCRLHKQKNLPMAIRAFEKFHCIHSDWTLDIYGEGEERPKLENLINTLNASSYVKLHGFCANIIEEIIDSKIYLSTSNYEGISNSMLEALALGIPAVVTDCPIGGAKLAVENGINGILIHVGDVDACASALDQLASDKLKLMGNEQIAISMREKFPLDSIMADWKRII